MKRSVYISMSCTAIMVVFLVPASHAEDPRNEFGVRANVLLGDGKPANDILGAGIIGRRHVKDGWFFGGSLDTYAYDFERPASHLGIAQDPNADVIDADGSVTTLAAFVGREYGDANNGFRWFWSLGVGVGSESVDDISGPTDAGGTFDLIFDAGNNVQLMGSLGSSYFFNKNWSASFTARLEHHFMDIKITDSVTGATSRIDSQSPVGAYLSLNYRF